MVTQDDDFEVLPYMEVLPYIVTVTIYGNTTNDVLPYMVTQESMCYHIW